MAKRHKGLVIKGGMKHGGKKHKKGHIKGGKKHRSKR